jgi:uncharacterized heparinase superfamily protein
MAKVGWSAGIDYVSGALSKPSKNGQHSCQKMLLGTHRVAATTSNACNRIYLRPKVTRSTAPSQDEMIARARFAAVGQAVATRSQDLMQINTDKQAFLAQRDTAGGCTTMKSYLWKVCGDAYDAEHPRS